MNWETVKLESVAEVIAGQSPESQYYNQSGDGFPFFQGKADFGYETPTVRYWCTKPTKIAKENDILLSVRAPVGPTNICNLESCIGRGLAAIRVGQNLNHRFLYWWFKSYEHKLSLMGNGSTFSAITTKDVKGLSVPLPPLPIQQQIADTLDKADALRRKDQELLDKYDELAQAVFYEMFGDPKINKNAYEVIELKKLIVEKDKITYGIIQPGKEVQQGVPVIRVGDFENLKIRKKEIKKVAFEIEKNYSKTRLQGDEILIACVGSVGKIALVESSEIGYNIVRATARIRADIKKISRIYLAHYLNLPIVQEYFLKETRTVSQPTLNISHIENTPILLPEISKQLAFEKAISNLELLKSYALKNQEKSEILFSAFCQSFF